MAEKWSEEHSDIKLDNLIISIKIFCCFCSILDASTKVHFIKKGDKPFPKTDSVKCCSGFLLSSFGRRWDYISLSKISKTGFQSVNTTTLLLRANLTWCTLNTVDFIVGASLLYCVVGLAVAVVVIVSMCVTVNITMSQCHTWTWYF